MAPRSVSQSAIEERVMTLYFTFLLLFRFFHVLRTGDFEGSKLNGKLLCKPPLDDYRCGKRVESRRGRAQIANFLFGL